VFDDFLVRPDHDVFVLGFPLGLGVAKHLALWKRGTIASEPMYDVDGKPMILIDTATRSSMSGSPVIAQINGTWMPKGSSNQKDMRIGIGRAFLGVYSSRLGKDEFLAQLGVVWKARVIEEIIAQGQTLDVMTATEAVPARADVETGEETNSNE
jgi:hypothetical protein